MRNFKFIKAIPAIILFISCQNETGSKQQTFSAMNEKNVPEKIQFSSSDSVPIAANLYLKNEGAPFIVLCHQANFNKFEYVGIAKVLLEKGFNCMAIDQRCGGGMIEEFNETNLEAKKRNKPVDYLDAEQDMIAAVNFASEKYGKKIILWGSSYSSTLALYTAIANENVKAVIAFSPGNYFEKEKGSLPDLLTNFTKPIFITSSREEAKETTALLAKMKMNENQVQFIPDSAGFHGSRALWKTSSNNEEYWTAINDFLQKIR